MTLAEFRLLAKSARSPAVLIPHLTAELLREADFTIVADNPRYLGAERLTPDGVEIELRVSRLNSTIAGTRAQRKPKETPFRNLVSTVQVALRDDMRYRPVANVVHHAECNWDELVRLI